MFEKLSQTSGLRSIVKFCHDPRKTDSQNIGRSPQPKNPACITETIPVFESNFSDLGVGTFRLSTL